jgi:cholestenol delta-isomerase
LARRVVQLSLDEAAIRYALCSLSVLNRVSIMSPADPNYTASKLRSYALQQYNHAIRCTQTLLAESSDGSADKLIKGLVACVLFVCYENFTGNHQVAHMHLQNGLKIITRECRKQHNSNIPKDIVQVFKRLGIQAITIGDSKIPYPDHLSKEHIELLKNPPTAFGSIEDSIDLVLHLCRRLFHRAAYSESYSEPCPISAEDLAFANKALERWNLEIQIYFSPPNTTIMAQLPRSIALLKIYQIIMTIIIPTGIHGQETLHDAYLDKYEEVIRLCGELLLDAKGSVSGPSCNRFFCFDIGFIFPLF